MYHSSVVIFRLYTFDGYVEDSKGKRPLVIDNLLLRGSVLRKTEWVIGVALNVGADSKIVRNMTKAPRKVSIRTWHNRQTDRQADRDTGI